MSTIFVGTLVFDLGIFRDKLDDGDLDFGREIIRVLRTLLVGDRTNQFMESKRASTSFEALNRQQGSFDHSILFY